MIVWMETLHFTFDILHLHEIIDLLDVIVVLFALEE